MHGIYVDATSLEFNIFIYIWNSYEIQVIINRRGEHVLSIINLFWMVFDEAYDASCDLWQ